MPRITFVYPNYERMPIPNVGLAYLISAVEKEHQVNLIDLTFCPGNYYPYLINNLKRNPPDVVGISVTSFSFSLGLKIAAVAKQLYPESPVIFGGVQATLSPEETLSHPEVDAVCIGEGEEAIVEYLECIRNKRFPGGVDGVWYKEKGEIIKNPLRPYRENLDTLSFPDWDHWAVEKYMNINGYFTGGLIHLASRGCPYDCTFCSNPALKKASPGRYYRLRSAENIVEEIKRNKEKYQKKGFRIINFTDETFGLDINQFREFTSLFKKNNLHKNFYWICGTRIEVITPEWAKLAAETNCIMVSLGIETGDDYIRREILKKNFSQKEITEAIGNLKKNYIQYRFNMMLNYPNETKKTVQSSLNLIRKLDPLTYHFFPYQSLPKSQLGPNVVKLDLKITMFRIYYDKMLKLFKRGFKLNGLKFVLDVFKYVFSINNCRVYPILDRRFQGEIEQKTIHEYLLKNRMKLNHENNPY